MAARNMRFPEAASLDPTDSRSKAPAGGEGPKSAWRAFFVSLILFRLALDYAYGAYVVGQYEFYYLPIRWNVDYLQYATSLALYLLSFFNLRPHQHSPGNIFQLMVCLFVIAPLTSQYGLDADKDVVPVLTTLAALTLTRVISEFSAFDVRSYFVAEAGQVLAIVVCICGILFLIAWTVVSGAVSNFNLDPERVYDFRSNVSSALDIGVLAYVNLWIYKSFTIYLVCVCLEKKRYIWLLPILLVQAYFAGVTSHKSVFFMPILTIGFWYFLSRGQRLYKIAIALAILVVAAALLSITSGYNGFAELAVRRTFYVPSGLTFAWFEYFYTHPYVLWSDKLLSAWIETQYTGFKIPNVVGEFIFIDPEVAANNGMVSAGFSHAGYLGVLAYALVLGVIVNLLNHFSRTGIPIWFTTALSIGPLRTAIADSDLPTAFLSHGIMISLLLLLMHRRRPALPVRSHPEVRSGTAWPPGSRRLGSMHQ